MINGAIKVIAERGSGASLTEFARAAGYSHALISTRFGSKSAFIEHVRDELIDNIAVAMARTVEEAPAENRILALIDGYLAWMGESGDRGRAHYVLLTEALVGKTAEREAWSRLNHQLRASIEQQLRLVLDEASLPDGVDAESVAISLTALLRGVSLQFLVEDSAVDISRTRRAVRWLVAQAIPGEASTRPEAES